jgi:hypothetical protein
MDALKDVSSRMFDQWWMWSAIFTDLLTRWIAKPYLLSSFHHNYIMLQLVAMANNTPSFWWLIVKNNVSYVQEIASNIVVWILCLGWQVH